MGPAGRRTRGLAGVGKGPTAPGSIARRQAGRIAGGRISRPGPEKEKGFGKA